MKSMARAAIRERLAGNIALTKQQAQAAIALSKGRDVMGNAACAMALAGDTARAMHLADDLDRRFPEDTLVRFALPVLRAEAALRNSKTSVAMEAIAAAEPYELGAGSVGRMWLRGEVYLATHQGGEAPPSFRKFSTIPGLVWSTLFGPLAHPRRALAVAWFLAAFALLLQMLTNGR